MKVICQELLSHDGRETLEWSPWLTIGAEYHVVSVLAHPSGRIQLRIVDDQGSLGLFGSSAFAAADGTIPSNWVVSIRDGGTLELAPSSWVRPGLWEDYYDGECAAVHIVNAELSKMIGRRPDLPDLSGPLPTLELQAAARSLAKAQNTDPWKGLMLVQLHYVTALPAPDVLKPVLERLTKYWTLGTGSPETLLEAKRQCWEYLKKFPIHEHLDKPDTKFARALLCLVEPVGDDDMLADLADWFCLVLWDMW
ncbi:hypothetical protein AAHB33_05115 [Paenarthrobacter sp. S56]|uniref:hypothetical protein n=1 Tax=Paenarthrobacter sp. S56 TaxID=3138179 RepID=UPI00321ACB08